MSQPSLEQYVASRYLHDLQNAASLQASYREDPEMLKGAMDTLAAFAKAALYVQQNIAQKRASA